MDSDGIGGAAVLVDCVPSKTFIASTGLRTELRRAPQLGFDIDIDDAKISLPEIHRRVKTLATAQSADITAQLVGMGVEVIAGRGNWSMRLRTWRGTASTSPPRTAPPPSAKPTSCSSPPAPARGSCRRRGPDGERILTWRQLYDLDALPELPDRGGLRGDRR